MIGYRILSPAEEEMAEAALFYEQAAPGFGTEFLDEVDRTINRLRGFPQIGPPLTRDLRSMVLARFPFNIVYSIEPDAILVVAVAHQSRRPGYWQDRLSYG